MTGSVTASGSGETHRRGTGRVTRRAAARGRRYGDAMGPATRAADALIRLYQQRLSPRKGWTCAHLVAHGGQSCSAAVRDVVVSRGVARSVVPTVLRFVACYQAANM